MDINKNDKRILDLKNELKKKQESVSKIKTFAPITNSSIDLDGKRYNIQTMKEDELLVILLKLNSYLLSAKDLGIEKKAKISRYYIDEWITDVKSLIDIKETLNEKNKLKFLETQLEDLLSNDKKIELTLDVIEKNIMQ